jgi:RNA-directed DNA polymerase
MRDRATQALVKQALEPEWEARFEANSYGFRPGRGCHDAIGAIFNEARYTAKYVLDADIKGCFDHISHPALLNKLATYPAMRRIIRSWLKAGIMENQSFSPTLEGTPQGGVISPLLANIALHGIEQAVQKGTSRRSRPALVRYADDFVILHERLAVVEKARETVEEWLKGIGLELKPEKTRIVHTQHPTQGQVGFDFLGMTVRQFPMGKTHTGTIWGKPIGFKLLIKPSNAARKQHLRELSQIVKKHQTAPQWELIEALTPSIRGWANYHRTVVASQIFAETDTALHSMLRRWAKRRHPNKSQGWVSHKYWALDQGEGWKFKAPEGNTLIRHDGIHIKRHAKVRDTASPYDGDLVYWSQRLHEHPLLDSKVAKLLKLQHGKCAYCGLSFRSEDQMEKDHIIPRSLGGNDRMMNLQLLHRHCHDQKTAKDGSNKARKGQRYP